MSASAPTPRPRAGLRAELEVRRGGFAVGLSLAVEPGEVVALLGPNGAGKSTLLRALAGLLPLAAGSVTVGEASWEQTSGRYRRPAHDRSVGMVFQDYLLFPHLTVLDNVAFGLRARGLDRRRARTAASPWLVQVGIAELARSRPRQLSGGQAQRVALARALAVGPELLLLDEPLAALDARTRLLVRAELRRHLTRFGGAAVVVTHDPTDAAVLADRLVVLEHGAVVQQGTAAEVARRPRTEYVARLVGLNLLPGVAEANGVRRPSGALVAARPGPPDGTDVLAAFSPATAALYLTEPTGSPRNRWRGTVAGLEPYGSGVRVEVADVPDPGSSVVAEVTQQAVVELDLAVGTPVWVLVKASEVDVYPA